MFCLLRRNVHSRSAAKVTIATLREHGASCSAASSHRVSPSDVSSDRLLVFPQGSIERCCTTSLGGRPSPWRASGPGSSSLSHRPSAGTSRYMRGLVSMAMLRRGRSEMFGDLQLNQLRSGRSKICCCVCLHVISLVTSLKHHVTFVAT